MKAHKLILHAVKGLEVLRCGKDSVLDGVKVSIGNTTLEVVNLHVLVQGVCSMLHKLVVKVVLLNVFKHVGLESEILAALIVFKAREVGEYAFGLGLDGVGTKEVPVERAIGSSSVGLSGEAPHVSPGGVPSPVAEENLKYGPVVSIKGKVTSPGVFKGL